MVPAPLLQVAALADTLIVRQLPPVRTTFESVVFVASGLVSFLTLVLMVAVLWGIWELRKQAERTTDRIDELLVDLKPLVKDAREVVAESRETIDLVNTRARDTVGTLADQIDDLSALIGRINSSAVRVASITSTAVAGLKLGAKAFGIGRGKKKGRPVRGDDTADRPRLRKRG